MPSPIPRIFGLSACVVSTLLLVVAMAGGRWLALPARAGPNSDPGFPPPPAGRRPAMWSSPDGPGTRWSVSLPPWRAVWRCTA